MAGFAGHPWIEPLARRLRKEEDGTYTFAADDLSALVRRADGLTGADKLFALVGELLKFSVFLEQQGHTSAAALLADRVVVPLADRMRELTLGQRQGAERVEELRQEARRHQKRLRIPTDPDAGISPTSAPRGIGLRKPTKK